MDLIQELRNPIPIITTQEDGTDTVEFKPPTRLSLMAANALEKQVEVINGMARHIESLNKLYGIQDLYKD